ncbi:MAG: alpha/beta hydrolase [Luteimonas sp.]|nr:alpha/beta hydrolase [Luteimonas sp.]
MPLPKNGLRALVLSLVALLCAGCERAIFGVLNHGLAPPATSVVFDPEHRLGLDVYRAQGRTTPGPAPVVVFFYGGSWQRGEREQYRFVGRRLAENGILAIVADYRTWPRAGFPDFMTDAAHAVAWAHAHAAEFDGDPRRVFIAGHSAGAQIAGLLGTDGRYLSSAGIDVHDIAGVIGLSGPYDFDITGQYVKIFGPRSQWPAAQAVNFVDGNEPPFLLIHGADDRVVEARDSIELAGKLEALGEPVSLRLLPDAGHFATVAGLYRDKRAPEVLPAILGFIHDPARKGTSSAADGADDRGSASP